MKKVIYLILAFIAVSCSSDDIKGSSSNEIVDFVSFEKQEYVFPNIPYSSNEITYTFIFELKNNSSEPNLKGRLFFKPKISSKPNVDITMYFDVEFTNIGNETFYHNVTYVFKRSDIISINKVYFTRL